MNRDSPQMRDFAKHLIIAEAVKNKSSQSELQIIFRVTDHMRPHLATLMGKDGFRALLSRALALARVEVSWLSAIRVDAGGALEGFEEIQPKLGQAEFFEGKVVLLAQLLGLLVTFLGPGLMARLAKEIWPEISTSQWDFRQRGKK